MADKYRAHSERAREIEAHYAPKIYITIVTTIIIDFYKLTEVIGQMAAISVRGEWQELK